MAFNKNFVVRHGLEVDTDLIIANADTNKVGIASTAPRYELDVRGGIGATDIIASGVGTFTSGLQVGVGGTILSASSYIGINTANPSYLLDIRASGSGVTAVYVQGGIEATGLTTTQDLSASGNLGVSGVSTFYNNSLGNVTIGSGNTSLLVEGDARIVGVLTIGTSSITIDGVNNKINVGTGFTITSDGIQASSVSISTISNLQSDNADIVNINSTGITTLGVTTVTNLTTQNIYNSGITTLGVTTVTDLTTQQLNVTGVTTVTDLTTQNIYSSGISTLGGVLISSGIITAVSGVVTYYGDGSQLQDINVSEISFTDFNVTGFSTLGVTTVTDLTTQNIYNSGITTLGITTVTDLTTQNIYNSGITTLGVTEVTNLTTQQLNVTGVTTLGVTTVTDLTTQNIYNSGITTLGITGVTDLTAQQLNVTGVTTVTDLAAQQINVSGVVTATTFYGSLTGTASTSSASATAYGLTGSPNVVVGFATVNSDLFVNGNLTVDGTQTIINTSILDVEDINVGIASTSTKLSNASLDGAGITIYGISGDKTLTYSNSKNAFETNIPVATNELRVISGAEKITRVNGNTATINYSTTGSNIGLCTNPSGDVTLDVVDIPTTSDFDDYAITFAVIVTSSGTARTCTAVNLNGVSKTIKWAGGSLSNAISGVTTSTGYTIYNFTGINTVGSASTTTNYEVFGSAAGGFY